MARDAHKSLCSMMGLVSSGLSYFDEVTRTSPALREFEEIRLLRDEVAASYRTWEHVYELMKEQNNQWPESCSFTPEEYNRFLAFYEQALSAGQYPESRPDVSQVLELGLRMFEHCIGFCRKCLSHTGDSAEKKLLEFILCRERERHDRILACINRYHDLVNQLEGHPHVILDGC
ncbi:MAG: hypothetical protein ACOC0U_00020 [Desulfovibrionales bacterium]